MISGSRKNRPLRPFTLLLLLGAVAFAAGCSTAESPGGSGANMNHVLPSGSSVAGWLVVPSGGTHASSATLDYVASNGGSSGCTQCHGSDLSGGISKVSCFGNPAGCHHGPVANWATPAVHGATAKQAPGSSGFASCQICHGNNFSGRLTAPACVDCHGVSAPHPARPWRGPTFTHTDHEHLERAGLRAVPLPGVARTTRRTTRPPPPRRGRRPDASTARCATARPPQCHTRWAPLGWRRLQRPSPTGTTRRRPRARLRDSPTARSATGPERRLRQTSEAARPESPATPATG